MATRTRTVVVLCLRNGKITGIEHSAAVDCYVQSFLVTLLCCDGDNARTATCTVKSRCSSTLQHVDRLYVVGIDVAK